MTAKIKTLEKIAYNTLKLNDAEVKKFGLMTKEQARMVLAEEVVKTFKKQYPKSYKVFLGMTEELTRPKVVVNDRHFRGHNPMGEK